MTFRVGMKVVCVDASRNECYVFWGNNPFVIEGVVYTISGFDHVADEVYGNGVYLKELRSPIVARRNGPPYPMSINPTRFRPVAYPKQSEEHDRELFHPLLTKEYAR